MTLCLETMRLELLCQKKKKTGITSISFLHIIGPTVEPLNENIQMAQK